VYSVVACQRGQVNALQHANQPRQLRLLFHCRRKAKKSVEKKENLFHFLFLSLSLSLSVGVTSATRQVRGSATIERRLVDLDALDPAQVERNARIAFKHVRRHLTEIERVNHTTRKKKENQLTIFFS
jgi:hypothetical protein